MGLNSQHLLFSNIEKKEYNLYMGEGKVTFNERGRPIFYRRDKVSLLCAPRRHPVEKQMFLSSKFFFAGADSHVKAPKSPLLLLLNSNGARKVEAQPSVKGFGVLPIFLDIPLLTVLERKKTRKSFWVWVAFTLIFIGGIINSSIKDFFLLDPAPFPSIQRSGGAPGSLGSL